MTTTTYFSTAVPGPIPMPILGWRGNLLQFFKDPIVRLRLLHQKYGPIVANAHGRNDLVFIFTPEYTRQLLTDTDLFYNNPIPLIIPPESPANNLNQGLISLNGADHRRHRKLLMPAFHRKQIETYCADMISLTQHMLNQWRVGQQRDIAYEIRILTRNIATKTLFGLDSITGQEDLGADIERALAFVSSIPVIFFQFNLPGLPYWFSLKNAERLEARIRRLIAEKRSTATTQNDVLATLIRAHDEEGSRLTDAELIGEAYVLYVAGHETSANVLTGTLFLLEQHPSICADLLDELDTVLHGAAPTIEQLPRLVLLERVIKESMRLLPPAYAGSRLTTTPATLGQYEFPANTSILYSPYITHRLPELYAEPQRFAPQRWEHIDPAPYEYLPFGAGPRMCIGATFAMTEIKIVLAMVLQRYRLALAPRARIDRRIKLTLQLKGDLQMTIIAQDRQFRHSYVQGNIHEMVDLPRE